MLEPLKVGRVYGWSIVIVVLAVVLGYGMASSTQAAKAIPQPGIGLPVLAQDDCGPASMALDSLLLQEQDGGACWADAAEMGDAAAERARPKRGYCRCGCGIRCATSADCGGDPCQAFVTCC